MIEIMMVVSIIAIIGALSIPMFKGSDSAKLRGAAAILAADIDAARTESVTHGEDRRLLVFDTTNHAYHIAPASDTSTPITVGGNNQPYTLTYGQGNAQHLTGVTIQSASVGGDDELGFGVYGELDQATDAAITLEANGATITLIINATTGEVTIGQLE